MSVGTDPTQPSVPAGGEATESSICPAVLAAGLTLVALGIVTASLGFSVIGAVAMAIAIGGWIEELRHG